MFIDRYFKQISNHLKTKSIAIRLVIYQMIPFNIHEILTLFAVSFAKPFSLK